MKGKRITAIVSAVAITATMMMPFTVSHAEARTITVGPDGDCQTIRDAVARAKEINPQSEDERVTINVAPGNYEEQVRMDGMKYITLQKTPGAEGSVNLSWYFCTGYCTSNTDLNGLYNPDIDWSLDETWNGYSEGDEKFTKYEIGQILNKGNVKTSKLSYYDKNGVKHKDEPVNSGLTHLGSLVWGYDKMAALIITRTSSDITVKDINVVNSVPVMKIQAEIEGHLTPEKDSSLLDHNALSICSEDTPMVKPTADIFDSNGHVDKTKYKALAASGHVFTPGESAWLLRSSAFNERGHALASLGDRIIFENVRARGNQDSVWVSDGRAYFKNCNLIGGTDYIYGSANAVFDSCKLGFAGFTDYAYGNPLATPNTDSKAKYGYLFYNCTVYNECAVGGVSNFGGPWGASGQSTFYNTTIDDDGTIGNSAVKIDPKGWARFGAENGTSRLYEYGTKNKSGNAVDFSKRIVNKTVAEGGTGMGTVLDKWQILEFNPRNYFSKNCDPKYKDDWDPMNFNAQLTEVDAAMAAVTVNVPSGEETNIALPISSDSNVEFHWVSDSLNAVVSNDEKSITVVRPAAGEEPIESSVVLYARNKTTGLGDKKTIPVNIEATTDRTNVFNIAVKITQSAEASEANNYTVTITKDGALIKEQTVTVPSGQTEANTVIENVPASNAGIAYDIKIVPSSDEFSITAPENGKISVTGKTGVDVPISISAQKLVDETVKLDVNASSSAGDKAKIDLIALAKAAGADNCIEQSDSISVKFDATVNKALTADSFVDISSGEPSKADSATQQRFTVFKLNKNWTQIDAVDNSQGFSGSSDGTGQRLNLTGKMTYPSVHTLTAVIDYKNSTVSVEGSNIPNGKWTFASFPENAQKGNLSMGIFVGKEEDDFVISNVEVTYKKLIKSEKPEVTGKPVVPTTAPDITAAPDKAASIANVKTENGNTVVTLANITSGVVIAVKYNGSAVAMVKTKEITENPVTIEGIEADKVMVWNSLAEMQPVCKAYTSPAAQTTLSPTVPASTDEPIITDAVTVDFTKMTSAVEYSKANGQGFVTKSSAIMPSGYERQVAPVSAISVSSEGAQITEKDGAYLHKKNNSNDGDDFNNGGLIYRIDTGKPGAYHLEVEVTGTNADTRVAPTGMDAGKITGTGNWDNCNQVPRTVSAKWEDNKWSYDFATGEKFIEIEIEPKTLATASAPQTVGVKKITVTPVENESSDRPTIHILGDSTQKTYSFNETISAWGQTLGNYFDKSKVNVINYSMGGRAMKSNYCEGRFDEILISGKKGDFVFIHSAHNDETVSTNRFSRGAGTKKDDFTVNDANYNRWLDMYVEAIKARGMTPVLVTSMPRVNGSTGVPNSGFNPNSPANMRAKAASDSEVALAELYDGAKAYIAKLEGKEVAYIYNNTEAGETPAENAANGANGDGTHYKEAASKQWSRIILQSIYDQSVASTDTYTDKAIMTKLVSLMSENVKSAAQTHDWSAVFPEMASDVSAVDVVPGAQKQSESNFYYRNNIEKALQLGLLHKDASNLFKPTETITVGEFARGVEKAFGLEENVLTSYTKTYAELSAEAEPVSLYAVAEEEENESSDNGVSPLAEGELTVTVTQPTGGTVTVYNNSAYKIAPADITANVAASAVISDNDYFTFTAPSEVVKKTDKNASFSNKDISINAIEVRNNGTKQPSYTAKADGALTLYLYFDNTKIITCENKTDGTKSERYIEGAKADEANRTSVFGEVVFNVEKGKTYEIYTNGGTGRLFGIMYASTNYPQSTTSLTVNSGDEIRVVATPDENYVNKSISLNGEVKATSKEYVFTIISDTSVSAEFSAEPALVEVTKIASDAALTREAMGAVLYDAYLLAQGKDSDGKWNKFTYMTKNGSVPSPDDPNYDPNIKYEGATYIPLTGWGALEDKNELDGALYSKVKEAYNLGLMRTESGISRASIVNGTKLEPKTEVTRAKAAKALVFAFILTQPLNGESQTVPEGYGISAPSEIILPNTDARTTVFN